MKIKVENIQLKSVLTEATYQDAFGKIKKGDEMTIKTGAGVMKGIVVDKFSNQITVRYKDTNYIMTSNSLDGSTLYAYTTKEINGQPQKIKHRIKGVYNIQIRRNGQPVVGVQTNTGRPQKAQKQAKSRAEIHRQRYDDLIEVFDEFEKDDKIKITTGKLITKGSDKGSLLKNSVTEIYLHIEKVGSNMIRAGVIEITGAYPDKYKDLEDGKIFIAKQSISFTDEGIILTPVVKNGEDMKKIQINDVVSIDNEGKYIEEPEVSMQDLMQSPRIRAMMYKNPSLLDKILGFKGGKGIVPLEKQLRDLRIYKTYKRGQKVKFKYFGEPMHEKYRFNFLDGKVYIGKFTKDTVIKRTSDNRKESMYVTLGKKLDDKTYEVNITHVVIKDGQPHREELGKAKIKILDTNF